MEKLVPAIKDLSLPPLDRLGIENDQFALVSDFVGSIREINNFVNIRVMKETRTNHNV